VLSITIKCSITILLERCVRRMGEHLGFDWGSGYRITHVDELDKLANEVLCMGMERTAFDESIKRNDAPIGHKCHAEVTLIKVTPKSPKGRRSTKIRSGTITGYVMGPYWSRYMYKAFRVKLDEDGSEHDLMAKDVMVKWT
jgi:hypothetical protein